MFLPPDHDSYIFFLYSCMKKFRWAHPYVHIDGIGLFLRSPSWPVPMRCQYYSTVKE